MAKKSWIVDREGISLIAFLQSKLPFSKRALKKAIDEKFCLVDEQRVVFSSRKLHMGAKVTFDDTRIINPPELKKLYEDEHVIVYNKPAFFTLPPSFDVHRLDKEASGVVLFAKKESDIWIVLFRKREVHKEYFAVCQSSRSWEKHRWYEIDVPIKIAHQQKGRKFMVVSPDGKTAKSRFQILAQNREIFLVKVQILTGRTHQIRVHLAHEKLYILGDHLYGKHAGNQASRLMLHSYCLQLVHPLLQKNMCWRAAVPVEFLEYFDESMYT